MNTGIRNLPEDTVVIETVHRQPGKWSNRSEINNIAYADVKLITYANDRNLVWNNNTWSETILYPSLYMQVDPVVLVLVEQSTTKWTSK
jgi:hypothetical protein